MRLPLLAAMLLAASPLTAQDAAPERLVEGYGAWELRCERATAEAPLACELMQSTTIQGQSQPVSQIAIGRATPGGPLMAVVQMPLGVWLPSGASLDLGAAAGAQPITLKRCLPGGCIGDVTLDEALVAALSDEALTESALVFEMEEGQPARVPVVHTGFADALAALTARQTP